MSLADRLINLYIYLINTVIVMSVDNQLSVNNKLDQIPLINNYNHKIIV